MSGDGTQVETASLKLGHAQRVGRKGGSLRTQELPGWGLPDGLYLSSFGWFGFVSFTIKLILSIALS